MIQVHSRSGAAMSVNHEAFTQGRIDMKEVTKDEFFAVIGPQNVHPRSERNKTVWETSNRVVVGISTPGYMCKGPVTYQLVK